MHAMLIATLIALAAAQPVAAQETAPEAPQSTTVGTFLGAHVDSSALTTVATGETSAGAGASLTVGYGLTPRFAVLATISGARLGAGHGDAFTLGHLDVAGRWHFGGGARRFVPHLDAGLSGRSTSIVMPGQLGRTPYTSVGPSAGAGFNYYVSPALALGSTLRYGFGDVTNRTCATSGDVERSCAASTRLQFGLTWFPRQR